MKILLLIDSLDSGGAERQMSYLASGLQRAGHDVTLVVFSEVNPFYKDIVEKGGVTLIFDIKGFNKYRRILRIRHWVKILQPATVIAYKDGVTMAACLARLLTPFRLIVSERNTTQELSRYERIKFALYRFADVIVPNSFSQARFIKHNYPDLYKKTAVITNALNTDVFAVPSKERRNKPLICVTVARIASQKNVLRFLDAVARLKNRKDEVVFKWFGNQDHAYFSAVQEKVKNLELEDMIGFYPAVKNVVKEYGAADFLCLPSIYEGFPNVVCEAMSCGLPIICSNVCDNPSIVADGINGFLFDPNNPSDIATSIEKLLKLSLLQRQQMGLENRRKIEDICSQETFIAKYLSLVE